MYRLFRGYRPSIPVAYTIPEKPLERLYIFQLSVIVFYERFAGRARPPIPSNSTKKPGLPLKFTTILARCFSKHTPVLIPWMTGIGAAVPHMRCGPQSSRLPHIQKVRPPAVLFHRDFIVEYEPIVLISLSVYISHVFQIPDLLLQKHNRLEYLLAFLVQPRPCLKNTLSSSKQPNHDSGHINKSKKRFVQFIKSCSNSAILFDCLKEAFNEVTFFVQVIIYSPRLFCIAFGRNHDSRPVFLNIHEDVLRAIGLIAKQVAASNIRLLHEFDGVSRINTEILRIRILTQLNKNFLPNAIIPPLGKTSVNTLPRAVAFWKLSPLRSAVIHPQHTVQHRPVVFPWASLLPCIFRRQQWLNTLPLFIGQFIVHIFFHAPMISYIQALCNFYVSNKD